MPLTGSIDCATFRVDYFIRCFIKIDSVFEVGQGPAVDFPILIVNQPSQSKGQMPPLDPAFNVVGSTTASNYAQQMEEAHFSFNNPAAYWSEVCLPRFTSYVDLKKDLWWSQARQVKLIKFHGKSN